MADRERHININATARVMPPQKGGDQLSLDSVGNRSMMSSLVGMELRDYLIS